MPVLEDRLDPGFCQVPNELLYDDQISMKAKALYAYLISKPPDWTFYKSAIVDEMKESKRSVGTAIEHLEEAGLLEIRDVRDGEGNFDGTVWTVYPYDARNAATDGSTDRETTNRDLADRSLADRDARGDCSNTDRSNTEHTNGETSSAYARDPDLAETTRPTPPCDEYFDVDREPLPKDERWDMMALQHAWRDDLSRPLDVADTLTRQRVLCLLAHFTEDEIREALAQTRKNADRPSWSYFRAVLESDDDAGSDDEQELRDIPGW